MIGRREFITLLGGAAAAWSFAARAQQPDRMRRIGMLIPSAANDSAVQGRIAAFQRGLRELGWTEGRKVAFDYRFAGGDTQRIRASAAELLSLKPDLILTSGAIALSMLRQETRIVPIVFAAVTDPVSAGFVNSLARPGGNITGVTNFEYAMAQKWLQMLKETAPRVTRVGLFQNPQNADWPGYRDAVKAVAPSLGVEFIGNPVSDDGEIERAMAELGREPNGGIVALPDVFLNARRDRFVALAAQYRLPAVYPYRSFVASGGLMSYGPDLEDIWRKSASYVDRILKGEKPADLPVQAPTKYEQVINLKAAKALGLDLPPILLARADEVIE